MKKTAVFLLLGFFLFTSSLYGEDVFILFEDAHRDVPFSCCINFPAAPNDYDSERIDNDEWVLLLTDMADLIAASEETTGISLHALIFYPYFFEGEELASHVEKKAEDWKEKELGEELKDMSHADATFPDGRALTLVQGVYAEENLYSATAIWHNDSFCISLSALGENTTLNRFIIDNYVTSLELSSKHEEYE